MFGKEKTESTLTRKEVIYLMGLLGLSHLEDKLFEGVEAIEKDSITVYSFGQSMMRLMELAKEDAKKYEPHISLSTTDVATSCSLRIPHQKGHSTVITFSSLSSNNLYVSTNELGKKGGMEKFAHIPQEVGEKLHRLLELIIYAPLTR